METTIEKKSVDLGRYGRVGLLLGLVCGLASIVLSFSPSSMGRMMAQSYLFAFVFFVMLTLGFLGLTLLHHTLRGKWGLPVLRIFEAGGGAWTLGVMAVLFIPVLIPVLQGHSPLYEWSHAEAVAKDAILKHKEPYLNPWGFAARFAIFFLFWMAISHGLRKSTVRQDESGNFAEEQRRTNWAAPGLVAFFLTITFAFTDWVMSLEPHWFSTIYGLWLGVGSALAAMALTTLIVTLNKDREPYKGLVTPALSRDWGNLLLAMTMLWAYTSISQYLIIWSGNLAEFTGYFKHRSENGWGVIGLITIIGQFFIPFMALVTPRTKAVAKSLALVCGWILVMRLFDVYQVVVPAFFNFGRPNPIPMWTDIVALVGIGGLWVWAFSTQIARASLLPNYDARLKEADAHAH